MFSTILDLCNQWLSQLHRLIWALLGTLRFLFNRLFFVMIATFVAVGVLVMIPTAFVFLFPLRTHTLGMVVPTLVLGGIVGGLYGAACGILAFALISVLVFVQWMFRLPLSQRVWEWGLPLVATVIFSPYHLLQLIDVLRTPYTLQFSETYFIYVLPPIMFFLVCVRAMREYFRERLYPRKHKTILYTYSRYGDLR